MNRTIRDFLTVLKVFPRDSLVERLDAKMRELLEALDASHDEKAKGSLTLTVTFQRLGDRKDIHAAVKLALPPEAAVPPTTLFTVEDGLSLEHPRQSDMFSGPRDAAAAR